MTHRQLTRRRVAMIISVFWVTLMLTSFLFLAVGCQYTHPSIATPDLVERVSNGHIICYYRNGPDRGYAKCCPECPMHDSTSITTKGPR